jgi:hypothetical protein
MADLISASGATFVGPVAPVFEQHREFGRPAQPPPVTVLDEHRVRMVNGRLTTAIRL